MSDQGCLAGLCGLCCVTLFSAFEPWCNSKRFGGNCCACCCSGPKGCCHSCFDEGFNKDSWDEEDAQRGGKKEKEVEGAGAGSQAKAAPDPDAGVGDRAGKGENQDPTSAKGGEIAEQPLPTVEMDPEGKPVPVSTAT